MFSVRADYAKIALGIVFVIETNQNSNVKIVTFSLYI